MCLNQREQELLKSLAAEYMEAANLPAMDEKKRLWKALNRGEMERPMVAIDQLPWHELAADPFLHCEITDPYWRGVEDSLRKTLYQVRHFPADMVLDPCIRIPMCIHNSGYGLVPKSTVLGEQGSTACSYHFENLLRSMEDVEKITPMVLTHDEKATAECLETAGEVLKDIAPVRAGGVTFHLGVWDYIAQLMSVEEVYYAFADCPELLHAVMEKLTAATIHGIEDANRLGIHDDNINTCHCSYIYTDELLPDSLTGKGPHSKNCWAFGLAQLFTSVSNEYFEEFELPYISRMAEYFGSIYYGCCDRLDHRLHLVTRIPGVRKISCSPWSDRKRFAEGIGQELVMSFKPSPAFLAGDAFDEQQVREDLTLSCSLAKENGVNLELILKDVSTVRRQPERLTRWAEIAMEVVQKYSY